MHLKENLHKQKAECCYMEGLTAVKPVFKAVPERSHM